MHIIIIIILINTRRPHFSAAKLPFFAKYASRAQWIESSTFQQYDVWHLRSLFWPEAAPTRRNYAYQTVRL